MAEIQHTHLLPCIYKFSLEYWQYSTQYKYEIHDVSCWLGTNVKNSLYMITINAYFLDVPFLQSVECLYRLFEGIHGL